MFGHYNRPVNSGYSAPQERETETVDDLVVAGRSAELELQSMKRYFSVGGARARGGIDGLADEIMSSSSDDENVATTPDANKSSLDALLAKHSMVGVDNADSDVDEAEGALQTIPDENLEMIPKSVVVPYGSRYISLGKVHGMVDGFLVIGHRELSDSDIQSDFRPCHDFVACDVESLVFLSGSDPLPVLGMVVDTLGSTKNPMHLVLVTNKPLLQELERDNRLTGAEVCTIESHCRVVEVNEINGSTLVNGMPQLQDDQDDYDDDGAEKEDVCIEDQPPSYVSQPHSGGYSARPSHPAVHQPPHNTPNRFYRR